MFELSYSVSVTHSDTYFFQQQTTISDWNRLPFDIVEAEETTDDFK